MIVSECQHSSLNQTSYENIKEFVATVSSPTVQIPFYQCHCRGRGTAAPGRAIQRGLGGADLQWQGRRGGVGDARKKMRLGMGARKNRNERVSCVTSGNSG